MTDNQTLREFAKTGSEQAFQPLAERSAPGVYAAAFLASGSETEARELATAAFQVLVRKARRLPRNTNLGGWLIRAVLMAAGKPRSTPGHGAPPLLAGPPAPEAGTIDPTLRLLLPALLERVRRMNRKLSDAVATRIFLGRDWVETAAALRVKEKKAKKRVAKGLGILARLARRQKVPWPPEVVGEHLTRAIQGVGVPADLAGGLTLAAPEWRKTKPKTPLVRAALRGLFWERWRRRVRLAATGLAVFVLFLAGAITTIAWLASTGRLTAFFITFGARQAVKEIPELAIPARSWPANPAPPLANAAQVRSSADIFRMTNIWPARLAFSKKAWKGIEPSAVPPVRNIMGPDGTMVLRNPKAKRSGLSGAIGFDFNWVEAEFELGGAKFTNVAARFRGNGTYIDSLYGLKRSFKVDLNKYAKGAQFGGVQTLNFLNLITDASYMHDALGYEFFRDAGVPAPRTAYAWLDISVADEWKSKPLGLYLILENLDGEFASDRFGSKKAPIFKPVTNDLFQDLGNDWTAYAPIYDLKTKATDAEKQRLIELCRLVTHATDADYGQRLGEYVDLDEFARFLAGLVLLSSYDGILFNGQNFYIYLDSRSNQFGFIPWDLDHAWGEFGFIGSATDREQASIWKPWLNRNRFLQRTMAVEAFREVYRHRLEEMLAKLFTPEHLYPRIDAMAGILRDPISAESTFRLKRFDQAVSTNWLSGPRDGNPGKPNRPVHQLKRFIENRGQSVRAQLDGKSKGVEINRHR